MTALFDMKRGSEFSRVEMRTLQMQITHKRSSRGSLTTGLSSKGAGPSPPGDCGDRRPGEPPVVRTTTRSDASSWRSRGSSAQPAHSSTQSARVSKRRSDEKSTIAIAL